MKKIISILLLISITATSLIWSSAASTYVICVIVNDEVLPITADTMPFTYGGQMYVPYTVFSKDVGISSARNVSQNTLVLFNFDYILTYDIDNKTVYDENLNSYSYFAIERNSTVYVPLTQVAEKFNITGRVIYDFATVIRISNRYSLIDDVLYVDIMEPYLNTAIAEYRKTLEEIIVPTTPDPEPPTSTVKPPTDVEEEPLLIEKLYLSVDGEIGEETTGILSVLNDYNIPVTFFIEPSDVLEYDDIIREIYGRGHKIGFYLDDDSTREELDTANQNLDTILGTKTRLIKFEEAGYDIEDYSDMSIWTDDFSATGVSISLDAQDYIEEAEGAVLLSLENNFDTQSALPNLLRYIKSENISVSSIYESDVR